MVIYLSFYITMYFFADSSLGRICSVKGCKGKLRDTIVNFGDDLHEDVCGGLPRYDDPLYSNIIILIGYLEYYSCHVNLCYVLYMLRSVRAMEECKKADVVIALGSSLLVTPACDLPKLGAKLIICNMQETPLDSMATVRVFATCDAFMQLVSKALGVQYLVDVPVRETKRRAQKEVNHETKRHHEDSNSVN